MQTFLPYPSFVASARVLDDRRLGKQRVEALQVFRALTRPSYGWKHHPAVRMWAGSEEALVRYGLDVCDAWRARGRRDTVLETLSLEAADVLGLILVRSQEELAAAGAVPSWLGDDPFHASHRSRLLQKDPAFYGPLFPGTPDDLDYVWPAPLSGG